jgi:hypothetical protein
MKKIVLIMMLLLCMSLVQGVNTQSSYVKATFLNQDPDPAEPGKYVELRWKIEKKGNDELTDLSFRLKPAYPFSFDGSDTAVKELGNWIGFSSDKEYYTLYYKLKVDEDALESDYNIELDYRLGSNYWIPLGDWDIRVDEEKKPNLELGKVISSPKKLQAGLEEAQLDIELTNIGNADAKNVKIELVLPDGFKPSYTYSEQDVLGTINEGSTKTANIYLDIDDDLAGGDYKANLNVLYTDAGDKDAVYLTKELPLRLSVKPIPKFTISEIRTDPAEGKPGQKMRIYFLVENKGGDEAKSVSVRAFKDSTQPFSFDEKSDFIGTLRPGESSEGILSVTIDENADPKKYLIDLEIRGIDDEEVIIDESKLSLTIAQDERKKERQSPLIGIVIIIIIVLTGIIAYKLGARKGKRTYK